MLIYRCDNCGQEHRVNQTVGNEFAYIKAGFGSLAVPVGDKTDLCRTCMKVAEGAHRAAERECMASAGIMKQAAVAGALGQPLRDFDTTFSAVGVVKRLLRLR